jgi:hypothetical protein
MVFGYVYIRANLPRASGYARFESARSTPIRSPPVPSFGEESSFGGPARGSPRKSRLGFGSSCLERQPAGYSRLFSEHPPPPAAPGEGPMGASAEREGGVGPQPKGRRARGERKGAREVLLARHDRTAQPRGGGPAGGC